MAQSERLRKNSFQGATHLIDDSGINVTHVENPHALIQIAGYLKHTAEPYERVIFRGQRALYSRLTPTLYRGITNHVTQANRHHLLKGVRDSFEQSAPIFANIPEYAREALLQHYGIHTTWVDAVDNIWIALWFAVHRAYSTGPHSEYLHFDRRKTQSGKKYGYILMISVDEDRKVPARKGIVVGQATEMIDLRIAAPSVFLRPHAQHGLLFRRKATREGRPIDYADQVRGVLRFDLSAGLEWLGDGDLHGIRSLFPPPYFDKGYQILLNCPLEEKSLGCIAHVGA